MKLSTKENKEKYSQHRPDLRAKKFVKFIKYVSSVFASNVFFISTETTVSFFQVVVKYILRYSWVVGKMRQIVSGVLQWNKSKIWEMSYVCSNAVILVQKFTAEKYYNTTNVLAFLKENAGPFF